jgi:impB/mucB/samB family
MHYFLSISLERFYSETLIQAEPSLSSRPLIVHYNKKVLDMNDLAEEAGAKTGMALSEAKALLHGGSFVAWEEEPYRDARNRWRGGVNQKVNAVYPKDSVSTPIRFDSPVDSLETLSRAYLDLAKSLSSALYERDVQGNELELTLQFDEGEVEKKRRKFMRRMQSTKAILSSINWSPGR